METTTRFDQQLIYKVCEARRAVAQKLGLDPMEAMCLNDASPHRHKMVFAGCDNKEEGQSVDDPDHRFPEQPDDLWDD